MIPNKAKIKAIDTDIKNLATKEEIAKKMLASINDYESRFIAQREDWADSVNGLWNQMDSAFRTLVNDNTAKDINRYGANVPDEWERAKVGTTQFYRQVTQKAANGYAVQTSKDMPFKYQPIHDKSEDIDHAADRAKRLNLLAKWSMKRDKFHIKSIEFWNQVRKYGNIPVMVEWVRREGTREEKVPEFGPDGTVIDWKFEEVDAIIENRPNTTILPVESVYADTLIGNIQDQDCVIVCSKVGLSHIVSGIRNGYYRDDLLELLNNSHEWDGLGGTPNADEKARNRALGQTPTQSTGQYVKREVFINAPIDEDKEKWDDKKNVPLRYRVTLIGNTPDTSIIARIERNQEPDDSIPIEMIHANPDDSDYLYHISDYEIVRANMSTETTLVRQAIDNNTLVCKPPLIEVRGAIDGNDRRFGPNSRFVADSLDSIREFNVRDISNSTLGILQYMKEDSNTALSIDKNMIGESFGARTSAQEAGTISSNTARPNLVNIEYVLEQYLGFIASRYKVGWENYGVHEQVIQITDEDGELMFIKPSDIHGEFDVVIDVMDDIKDEAIESNKLIGFAQTMGGIPQLAEQVDWADLATKLSENIMGTASFIKGIDEGDVVDNARKNLAILLNTGVMPDLNPAMNLRKHLEIYKAERKRWTGYEEQNQFIPALDELIASVEGMIGGGGGGQAQMMMQNGANEVIPEGEARRQLVSGVAGGFQ